MMEHDQDQSGRGRSEDQSDGGSRRYESQGYESQETDSGGGQGHYRSRRDGNRNRHSRDNRTRDRRPHGGSREGSGRHHRSQEPGAGRSLGSKEWKLIESLMSRSLDEQIKTRRWGIVFKSLTFVYLFVVLMLYFGHSGSGPSARDDHAAVVDIHGMIAADKAANADAIGHALRAAFESKHAKGIILDINSPGGSPVQAALVFDEIRRLQEKYPEKKVYAVISDFGTSGAYYIASAADEIYANDSSLVGSIGVISMNFGFTELMEKVGVERRVYTAGAHKSLLDPFLAVNEAEKSHFQEVLGNVHNQFINRVKRGRGDRLKLENQNLFDGTLWTGEQSLAYGLVDGLGSVGSVTRDIIGVDSVVNYTQRPDPLQSILGRFGVAIKNVVLSYLDTPQWR